MNVKPILLGLAALLIGAQSASAEEKSIKSPDGRIEVTVTDDGGRPGYKVTLDGKIFIDQSPLGVRTNLADLTEGMQMTASSVKDVRDIYGSPRFKKSRIEYAATEGVFEFSKDGNHAMDVVFHASGSDVAFKYRLYVLDGNDLCCTVQEEASGFRLPSGSTSFLCPQVPPMTGFGKASPSYETSYSLDAPLSEATEEEGYTFPCLFRNGEDGWIQVSETGVSGLYCGSKLVSDGSGLFRIAYPDQGEYNGNGTSAPGLALPGETPWRTITLGRTLAPIVETTVAYDLVEELYAPSKEYTYGKGSWSWIIAKDESVTYEGQKKYIDFSAAMGWETVLVDALWDEQIGRDKIAELAEYAASKGVSLFLWYNSNGYWNSAPQSPKHIMGYPIPRKKEMKWMESIGIKGIKVDFFGSDKQQAIALYEGILSDANDYGLQVIFHGCTLPRGWERMYPNFIGSEAVRASENLSFGQRENEFEAMNACLHPFIRNSVATMDFGGSTLNRYYNAEDVERMFTPHRIVTDVFELATAVLFHSPVQHFALAPVNLEKSPAYAIDFMKNVPTTWDDVKYIDGYPGKSCVIARSSGGKWYVAGVNADEKPLVQNIRLPEGVKEATLYAEEGVRTVKAGRKGFVKVTVPKDDGFILIYQGS